MPVKERQLKPGDRIQIGDTLLLFAVEDNEAAGPASQIRSTKHFAGKFSVQLHEHDSVYLNPLKLRSVNERMTKDLKTLLRISPEINSIRDQDSLTAPFA